MNDDRQTAITGEDRRAKTPDKANLDDRVVFESWPEIWTPEIFADLCTAAGFEQPSELASKAGVETEEVQAIIDEAKPGLNSRVAQRIAPLIGLDPVLLLLIVNMKTTADSVALGETAVKEGQDLQRQALEMSHEIENDTGEHRIIYSQTAAYLDNVLFYTTKPLIENMSRWPIAPARRIKLRKQEEMDPKLASSVAG